jgi:hypothetical protein
MATKLDSSSSMHSSLIGFLADIFMDEDTLDRIGRPHLIHNV